MPASEVFHKWGRGQLKMGRSGKMVPHTPHGQKIAEAIFYSERKNEQETGSPDTPRKRLKPRKSR